jgi:hypothetical protein
MGKKCSKSCACYDCRGDHTWELQDATDAAKRVDPGFGLGLRRDRNDVFAKRGEKAFDESWDKSMKDRYGKKGRR